jgi:hypothetical protein
MKNNPFVYSNDNKRYHTLYYENQKNFGKRVVKAVLDGGFTCPNKDGTKGYGGCIFCDNGSGYFTSGTHSLQEQLRREIHRIHAKYGNDVLINAYFQANTNTYAPAEQLHALFRSILDTGSVHSLSIGTRADCLPEDVIACLKDLNKRTHLTVELGLQSIHPATIDWTHRCYTHETFLEGYSRLQQAGIRSCFHVINGLPNETADMMLETAKQIAQLRPAAVKLQMLHIIRGTRLAEQYAKHPFPLLSMTEYLDIVVKQMAFLPPEIVIERVTGDGDRTKLIAPQWSANKIAVLGGIDRRQVELDLWQGKWAT